MLTCELVTRHVRILPLSAVLLLLGLVGSSEAQRAGRRVATLDLLSEHSSFFHGEEIIVHGEAVGDGVLTYLVSDQDRLLVLDVPPPPPGVSDQLEIIGIFYDVGRLEQGDPRVAELPFERLSRSLLSKAWPSVGEMLLVAARSSTPLTGSPATTLRTVALNPDAHVDQSVTLTGRFRGRNLYGDLPDSPGESRYDFVLTSADAAVWVVGKEPKGDGFELDVQARLDTGRWLEITGTVRLHEGMVVVDAGTIRLAEPVPNATPVTRVEKRTGPPPEVIFSTPFEGDIDVPTDTVVRIQFSRDMDADSFDGKIQVDYPLASAAAAGVEPPSAVAFETEYRGRNRVLEIRFVEPLKPFTALNVQLLEGITATDGVALPAWELSFFSGT